MELKCSVQTYDWGRRGRQSIVATLVENANTDFVVEENKAYAELWMGTHPNGPSYIRSDGICLKDYIDNNREVLGNNANNRNNFKDLPFLFKILSVGKALSIQAHPDKVINAANSLIFDFTNSLMCFYSIDVLKIPKCFHLVCLKNLLFK